MEIKTEYKRYQVLVVILCFLFFAGAAILLYNKREPFDSFGKAYALPLYLICMSFLFPYILFQKCPRVKFDDEFISGKNLFSSFTEDWLSVEEVQLSAKESFTFLFIFSQQLEATTISFNNGEKLILWEDMYQNLSDIREFLVRKVPRKIKDAETKLSESKIRHIGRRRYAGNPYTSFNTLLILGCSLWVFYGLIRSTHASSMFWLPIAMTLLFYLFFGTQMNYFIIDGDNFIIRNHYFFWKNKIIKLSDIREVTTETPYRRSRSLRILSGIYDSKLFGAGSLRDRNWDDLLKDLKSIGVAVKFGD